MFSFIKNTLSEGLDKIKKSLGFQVHSIPEEEQKAIRQMLTYNNFSQKFINVIMAKIIEEKKEWKQAIKEELFAIVKECKLPLSSVSCIVLVGINGSGKTTSAIKLARLHVDNKKTTLLIAADTFRAAAQDQLRFLASKYHIDFYEEHGQAPATVVFRGCQQALNEKKDITIIDTAGRIHQSEDLLKELKKIHKTATTKFVNTCVTYIVLDSLQGQSLLEQVALFSEYISIDGIIVTKLDSLAKPGILFSIMQEYKIPIVYVAYGEYETDLQAFNAEAFIDAMI